MAHRAPHPLPPHPHTEPHPVPRRTHTRRGSRLTRPGRLIYENPHGPERLTVTIVPFTSSLARIGSDVR